MKVALIADDFSVETGTGTARYAKELAQSLDDRGIDIRPISVAIPRGAFSGIVNHLFKLPYRVLKETQNVELLHATSPSSGFSFPLVGKKKKIVTYHDLTSFLCERADFPLHARAFNPSLYRSLANHCDRIIVVSTQTKEDLVHCLKIPAEKIEVVYLGVDEKFKPIREEGRGFFVIGYLGALTARKRVDYSIRSFYHLRQKHPELDVKFCIHGAKTNEYSTLVNLARDLKLDESIDFNGFVQDEKLVEVYNSFDVLVVPSEWEGFCLPILEAQRCGVPVIVREHVRIPAEVAQHCVKVNSEEEMADKMYEVFIDSRLREDLIKKGLEYSKQFTWENTAEKTIRIYEELLAR